jgi:transposase
VAIDMSPAHISVVWSNLPQSVVVFHHFHVINLYNDHLISTGTLEGTSNKIKIIKHQAYGFRDHELFNSKSWLFTKPSTL